MLRNAVGVSFSREKRVTKMYGSTLLALRGGVCQIPRKTALRNTLERPTSSIQFFLQVLEFV